MSDLPLRCAADIPLDERAGAVIDMRGATLNNLQPMKFSVVTKTIVGSEVDETKTDIEFRGQIYPLSGQDLMMKPEGQRKWTWWWVLADEVLKLAPDDLVIYLGEQLRVMAVKPYRLNGLMEYHLVTDYQGAGPR